MRLSTSLLSLRAAVFATMCVLLAAAGHGLAANEMPPVWAGAVGFAAVFVLGCLRGATERSLLSLCGAMVAIQTGLHMLFDAVPASARQGTTGTPTATMHHPVAAVALHHSAGVGTTAAHALVALAAAWWLRRGEAATWSLLRRVTELVPALRLWWRAPVPEPVQRIVVAQRHGSTPGPGSRLLLDVVVRRGPPMTVPVLPVRAVTAPHRPSR